MHTDKRQKMNVNVDAAHGLSQFETTADESHLWPEWRDDK